VLRAVMIAFLKGVAPIMAVEMGRRVVPGHVRPSFKEVEQTCRNRGAEAGSASGAAAGA
jgi:chemotaxis protein MotA